jgi:hypothetical protein
MEDKTLILPVNSKTFQVEGYSAKDSKLISQVEIDTEFSKSTDYIEYYVYDGNKNLLFPSTTEELLTYNVKEGHIFLDPKQDLERLEFDEGDYFIDYNFYRKHLDSNIQDNYYIEEISSDRKEIRLNSNILSNSQISSSTDEFISYRDSKDYFVDFYLNFGRNKLIIANNVKLSQTSENQSSILIKLYEPLPLDLDIKNECWVVEQISLSKTYQVKFPVQVFEPQDFQFISGPNLSLNIKDESGLSSIEYSYDTLVNSSITSSNSQIQSLLDEKGLKINLNYEEFSDFINFSSAETRLENFYHKVGLIENYTNKISLLDSGITNNTTTEFSSSKNTFEVQIDSIIKNFDSYEYFLYYNSGSHYSYPKSNTSPPYTLYSTSSMEVNTWLGSSDVTEPNYGGLLLSASDYDESNQNYLKYTIPEFLRDDPNNAQYDLFIDMLGQHFDGIWVYTKDIVNKFNADNRLDYGISKDLVADSIRDFGIKLYSNNFNTDDLYKAFLGLTPSGNTFPYENSMDYFPVSPGSEYIDTKISASSDIVPLDDANKRLYKRIYHNIPYLLKTKGTVAGLKALITSYGIPDTILKVNEFGSKNKTDEQSWDYKENLFNYALDLDGNNFFRSSFTPNSLFSSTNPTTLQLRFKTPGIPKTHLSQSIFNIGDSSLLTIEYTGSSYTSGSHLGSIVDPYNEYGTIKYTPDISSPNVYASAYLPIFDGGWWSVMTTTTTDASLTVANSIDNEIGFIEHSSIAGINNTPYNNSTKILIPSDQNISFSSKTYTPLSGSIQEIRYYSSNINTSSFKDFTLNPLSIKGTGNSTSEELIFRADLGSLSSISNRNSIHPKVTGSWIPTSSFNGGDSSFYIEDETFVTNKEYIHQNQPFQGIKNKINSRINVFENIIPEGDTLSSKRSIQQYSYTTQSITPDADYLEVAFSPTNQINDDIVAELGNFNLGEYIGDPRVLSSQLGTYPDLNVLRDNYFKKYKNSYNVKDFIRLIKFFDNSLFKMIKDFTPSRTNLTSGVVVKQHILERSVYTPVLPTFSDVTLSGSVKSFPRGYNTGSGDVGQSNYESGSSIYTVKGGTVGIFERYNGLSSYPSGSEGDGPNNIFNLTQSWDEDSPSIVGDPKYRRDDQREFYNGEFSQSSHVKLQRGLNMGEDDPCYPFTNWENVPELIYRLEFLSGSDGRYRIEDYEPVIPATGNGFERSDIDRNVGPFPVSPQDACINNSTESIYFLENSLTSVVVGSIAYSDIDLEGVFVGSAEASGEPLWWGVKNSGSLYNTKTLKIAGNGEVLDAYICRTPRANTFYFVSSSASPACNKFTFGRFLDPNVPLDPVGPMSWTYTSCSGIEYTETLVEYGSFTRCLEAGTFPVPDIEDDGNFINLISPCIDGGTTILVTSASRGPGREIIDFNTEIGEYQLSDSDGCWTFSSSAFLPLPDVPTQIVNYLCGAPLPTIELLTGIYFSSTAASIACSGTYAANSLYAQYLPFSPEDGPTLNTATKLYNNSSGTNLANSGWYSNEVVSRYWDADTETLGSIASCTSGGSGIGFVDADDETDGEAIDDLDNSYQDPYLDGSP